MDLIEDEQYVSTENDNYSRIIEALEPYLAFEEPLIDDSDYDDAFMDEPEFNHSHSILGKLKKNFLGIPQGTNIYIYLSYDNSYLDDSDDSDNEMNDDSDHDLEPKYQNYELDIKYVSEEDVIEYYEEEPNKFWYENTFIPGMGYKNARFNSEEMKFSLIRDPSLLSGRKELESIITPERIEAEIEVSKPIVTRDRLDRDKINIEYEKYMVKSDIYTLGVLKEDFLDIEAGTNILIIWSSMAFPNNLKRHTLNIYTISDFDRDMFDVVQDEYLWYQKVYVPGKKFIKCLYNKGNFSILEPSGELLEPSINHFVLSEESSLQSNNLIYYGITYSDFFDVPKDYLLVIAKTRISNKVALIYIPIELGLVYGYSWFDTSMCIIGKSYKFIDKEQIKRKFVQN